MHYFGYNHVDYTNCFDFFVHANFVHYIVDYQIDSTVVVFYKFVVVVLELLVL